MKITLLMALGFPEIIAILVIILLLFGAKKIPELMKGLGKGIKSFKDGINGNDDENKEQNLNNNSKSENQKESDNSTKENGTKE